MNKAIFMGRSGTLHKLPKNGVLNLGDFEILADVSEALNWLGDAGYFLAVVTVEKSILPGMDYQRRVKDVEKFIGAMVGFPIAFKYCMHAPAFKCSCRLPKPGLIQDMAKAFKLDLLNSVMIASKDKEVKAAKNAGIPTVLRVSTGRTKWSEFAETLPIFDTLLDAAKDLLELG